MSDGKVIIDTTIDKNGAVKDLKNLESSMKSVSKGLENSFNLSNANIKLMKLTDRVEKLKQKQKEIGEQRIFSEDYTSAEKELGVLLTKQTKLNEVIRTGTKKSISSAKLELQSVSSEIDEIRLRIRAMYDAGTAFVEGTETDKYKEISKQLFYAQAEMSNLVKTQEESSNQGSKLDKSMNNVSRSMKQIKQSSDSIDLSKTLKRSLKLLLKYGLGVRSLFVLYRKLRGYASEAFKVLAKSSDEVNQDLSKISNSFSRFKNSLATALQPLLSAITPALVRIIDLFTQASNTVGKFFAIITGQNYIYKATKANNSYAESLDNIGKASKGAVSAQDELNVISSDKGAGGGTGASSLGEFEKETVQDTLGIRDTLEKLLKPLQDISFDNLINSLGTLKDSLSTFTATIGDGLSWIYYNILVPLAQWTIEDALPAFINILAGAFELLTAVLQTFKPVWKFIWDNMLKPIAKFTGDAFVKFLNNFASGLKAIANNKIAVDVITALVAAYVSYKLAVEAVTVAQTVFNAVMSANPIAIVVTAIVGLIAIIGTLKNNWDSVGKAFRQVGGVFVDTWHNIQSAFGNVASFFGNAFTNGVNAIKKAFSTVSSFFVGVWTAIKQVFQVVPNWFTTTFKSAWSAVRNVFSKGGEIFKDIKNGVLDGFKAVVNGLIDGINKVISIPFNAINSVLRKIKNLSIAGAKPFKKIVSTIDIPQIPHLAKGAVIPPNKEFLAVLGDQKRGTNIETPLSTMIEAFDKALDKRNTTQEVIIKVDGDADKLFKFTQEKASEYTSITGRPAFT